MTILLSRIAAMAAALMIAFGAGDGFALDKIADVVALKGTTFVTQGGKTQPLALGAAVYQGDQLHAPQGCGAKLRFSDGSTISIGENTIMTVHTYTQQGTNRTAIFEMVSGIFRAIVAPLTGDSVFAVRTPTAVAAVRSTDWMLAAKANLTEVFVGDGAVAVRNLNPAVTAAVLLTSGDGTDVATNAGPTGPVKWGPPRIKRFQDATAID